jgi:MYXO-CTERM domain-containing protein
MTRRLLTLAALAATLAVAGPAAAHVGAPQAEPLVVAPAAAAATPGPEAVSAGGSATPGPWLLAAVGALALAAGLRRRRAAVTVLLVLLVLGAFETGLHSAHHLDGDAAECAVAGAAAQVGGLTVAAVAVERPDVVLRAAAADPVAVASSRALPPDLGRAPPAA